MFKLRVYGNDGNLHEEFFVNYQAALHRWAALADRSEPWLIPTLWERQPDGGTGHRAGRAAARGA